MNYELPYMGSKNKIAKKIVELLPSGERLVDLFAGGCAITHCALLSGKWKQVLANDINAKIVQLFKDALDGKFENETRWISKEDFFHLKDENEFVKVCWSFGNRGTDYIYGTTIEPYKKACHYAVVLDDWSELERLCPETVGAAREALKGMPVGTWQERKARRLKFGPAIKEVKRLEDLERIERLQGMATKHTASFTTSSLPYEAVKLKKGDVVYADPPYANTRAAYCKDFDHERFWNWCRCQAHFGVKVFVSEYNAPEDFISVFECDKMKLARGGNSAKFGNAIEKVFVHSTFKETQQ